MKLSIPLTALCTVEFAAARSLLHTGHESPALERLQNRRTKYQPPHVQELKKVKRESYIISQTANTAKYAVDGTAIPDVDFDIGESYAGLMPISNAPNASSLYFWFFPTSNEDGQDDLIIWLNGGPGCSSLEGFFQENGPVLWQYGTFRPVKNP